jgi:hypothetical protein
MAELVGLGASVVAFAGIAGQLAQGVSFLATFFGDLRDAPSDVQLLTLQLQTLGTVFQSLDYRNAPGQVQAVPPDVAAALIYCKPWIDKLDSLVRRFNDVDFEYSGRMRTWRTLSFAFRKKHFGKYARGLQDGLALLLQARMSYQE